MRWREICQLFDVEKSIRSSTRRPMMSLNQCILIDLHLHFTCTLVMDTLLWPHAVHKR